jgi:hypothetical protein
MAMVIDVEQIKDINLTPELLEKNTQLIVDTQSLAKGYEKQILKTASILKIVKTKMEGTPSSATTRSGRSSMIGYWPRLL